MTLVRYLLPLLAVLFVWEDKTTASAFTTSTLKTPESSSTFSSSSSFKTSTASGVIIDEAGARRTPSSVQTESREKTRGREPPGSPVNLFMPDEFQFYTLNANGQLVMKQMTKQEIQGMIAAGGGNNGGLPVDLGHHQTQLPVGEPKVSDVVQNVQKVLKDELNKPIQVPVSESSIPGSVNSQWTNMLPYILSGGSVDQQDVAQDTSIILPTIDVDQSYVDIVPLKGGKPEPETNYIPIRPTLNDHEIKLVSPKPTTSLNNGKPISLLGNMALDTGILEKHEYTQSTKFKPRPTTTPSYHKYTTTKSPLTNAIKDTPVNMKNSSSNKPTLYIPLSVSPSLLADAQIQNDYEQSGNANIHVIPEYVSKPVKDKISTKYPNSESTNNNPLKKPSTYVYTDEFGFTRVPMIQVPVITADKISSTTLRTNQQQTPMFEILPTISPGSMTSTIIKETSHPSKINVGPMGGFKKPDISHKPTTPHRPVYEAATLKPSTVNILSTAAAYHPIYEAGTRPSTINTASPTYRPVYEPTTKSTTAKTVTSAYRPMFDPIIKTSTVNIVSSQSYQPVYDKETTTTFKPASTSYSSRPTYDTSTLTSERFKVTQYPSSTYANRKATSLMPETEIKSSTPSGIKAQTQENLSTVTEFVTKPSLQSSVLEVTKLPSSVKKPTFHEKNNNSTLVLHGGSIQEESRPELSASVAEENKNNDLPKISEKYNLRNNNSALFNKSESSTEKVTNNYEQNTVLYQDTTIKLSDKTSDFIEKESADLYETTIPNKILTDSETSTIRYQNTEKSTQSFMTDLDQESLFKTEEYPINEDTSPRPVVTAQPSDTKTENYDYNTLIMQDVTTKEPDMIFKQTENVLAEQTETVIPYSEVSLISNSVKSSEETIDGTKYVKIIQKDSTDLRKGTTQFIIPLDETTTSAYTSIPYKESAINNDNQETTIIPLKESTDYNSEYADSTKDYSILVDFIQSMSNIEINHAEPEPSNFGNNFTNQFNLLELQKDNNLIANIASKNNSDEVSIIKNATKPVKDDSVSLEKGANSTDNYQSVKSPTQYSPISTLIKDFIQVNTNSTKESNVTPLYEKVEIITDAALSKDKILEITSLKKQNEQTDKNKNSITTTESNNIIKDKIKDFIQEEEMSTVKVIPIYDDDTVMYTIPPDAASRTTFAITPTEKSFEETKPTDSNDIPNTDLPDLQETFNNYMKEHYDSKLSTTDNYDEISHFTTFPPMNIKNSLEYKKNQPNSPLMNIDDTTIITQYQQKAADQSQFNTESTVIPNYQEPATSDIFSTLKTEENIKISKPETTVDTSATKSTNVNEITTKTSEYTTKSTVTSFEPDKLNISNSIIKERLNESLPTEIKIKNPIKEIEKIISEATTHTSNPSTVQYTLSNSYSIPSNIASGLIAGYPTYNENKPMKEYITSTTALKNTEINNLNTTDNPMQFKSEENKNNIINNIKVNQEAPLTLTIKKEENKKTNSDLAYIKIGEISEKETSEIFKNQSDSSIPVGTLPTESDTKISSQTEGNDDQINSSFIPPLEKISDLINQLKNSPDDYLVATTIVPLDNFETIFNESYANTNLSMPTTIFENSNKNLSDFENSTYVMLPTLPSNYTYDFNQSSTKPVTYSTSTTVSNLIKATTLNISSSSYNTDSTTAAATTITPKQFITEKPQTTSSTYRTTKGTIEKVQSTIDKSAGRINLEEEKIKLQQIKPTEPVKYTMKNKGHYSSRRPGNEAHQSFTRKATKTTTKLTSPTTIPSTERTTIKPSEDVKENSTEKWTLIPQKSIVEQSAESKKNPTSTKEGNQQQQAQAQPQQPQPQQAQATPAIVTLDHSTNDVGLDQSNKGLDKDVAEFLNMCNELSFKFWHLVNSGMSSSRSVTLSPFGMISTLAMIFLGARGTTSIQMNDILKLDDVVTFNPHLVFQNITDTVTLPRGQGIENAAFVRALFADRLKVRRIMPFYKEQAQQFYEGAVVDINFSTAGDILRRRTNLLIRKQTGGRIKDFVKTHTVPLRSPLTALSANVFQTSCDGPDASSEGRDGEMYFALAQTVKQRKLVPIPAVVWKSGVSAGYEPSLDATAVALGDPKRPVSFILVMPGQQGVTAPGDNLERLENRLFGNPGDALEKLLKVIIPRRVEVQLPKFSHRSIVNVTSALKKMGFEPLFGKVADLKGINGAGHDLYLADMIQMNLFCTCGDENKLGNRHLSETYPGTSPRHTRTWEIINNNTAIYDNLDNREQENSEASERCEDGDSDDRSESDNLNDETESQQTGTLDFDRANNLRQKMDKKRIRWFMPSGRRRCRNRRQAEPEKPRMRMDKPFLYLIRHNHSGLILHIGRFNPKSQS